jgi:hypothetical protein
VTPEIIRAISWAKAPPTKRDCLFFGVNRAHHYCNVDTVRRLTEIGSVCVEHYLGMDSCERCGMPVAEIPRKRYNWPKTGPGAERKGKIGTIAKLGEKLCRACQCADDPEYAADDRERHTAIRSNYPDLADCAVRSF